MNIWVILSALFLTVIGVVVVIWVRQSGQPVCPRCQSDAVREAGDGYSYICESCGEWFVL